MQLHFIHSKLALPLQVAKKVNTNALDGAILAPQPGSHCEGLPELAKAGPPVLRCTSPCSQAAASPEARSEVSGGPVHPCSACPILLPIKR